VEERVGEVGTTRWIKGKREDTRELLISPLPKSTTKQQQKEKKEEKKED